MGVFIVNSYIITIYTLSNASILMQMFVGTGSMAAGFCEWVRRLGEPAELLGERLPDDIRLLHVDAQPLLASTDGELRGVLEAARQKGALVAVELGSVDWIRAYGASRAAYQLATIQPDILFAAEEPAAVLGAPLEGLATVPVLKLGSGGCSVYGRRLAAPAGAALRDDALAAAFCVAFLEGAAPVEAAGRAVLVACMELAQ
jgi:hypothetical protein